MISICRAENFGHAGRMNRILCLLCTAMLCGAAEPTSKTNGNLQKILKRYPQADANKNGVLTFTEAKAFQKNRRDRETNRPKLKPTHADVVYGRHQRNRLDLWLVKSDKPTPLLVCIHGGGFKGGDKSKYQQQVGLIKRMHDAGVSVAAGKMLASASLQSTSALASVSLASAQLMSGLTTVVPSGERAPSPSASK